MVVDAATIIPPHITEFTPWVDRSTLLLLRDAHQTRTLALLGTGEERRRLMIHRGIWRSRKNRNPTALSGSDVQLRWVSGVVQEVRTVPPWGRKGGVGVNGRHWKRRTPKVVRSEEKTRMGVGRFGVRGENVNTAETLVGLQAIQASRIGCHVVARVATEVRAVSLRRVNPRHPGYRRQPTLVRLR